MRVSRSPVALDPVVFSGRNGAPGRIDHSQIINQFIVLLGWDWYAQRRKTERTREQGPSPRPSVLFLGSDAPHHTRRHHCPTGGSSTFYRAASKGNPDHERVQHHTAAPLSVSLLPTSSVCSWVCVILQYSAT